jgi:putative heme iron utilization protein
MNKMSKRVAVSVVSTLIAVSMIQTATAGERTRKHHVAMTTSEQVRNANASVAPFYVNTGEQGSFRDEALSPPAGH